MHGKTGHDRGTWCDFKFFIQLTCSKCIGNGLVEHISGTYTNWRPAQWTNSLGVNRYFTMERGVVTILEDGIYQVYAQVLLRTYFK